MLSSIGVPGLNGFVGEFLVLIGTFITHRWYAVVGATGVILAAVYLLWAYQRVFHGEPTGDNATMPDMNWKERWVMVPLLVAIVFLGVYPKPVLARIQPSVDAVPSSTCTTRPATPSPAWPARWPVSESSAVGQVGPAVTCGQPRRWRRRRPRVA